MPTKSDSPFTAQAINALGERYLWTHHGTTESPPQMFERVATHVAAVEKETSLWSKRYFELMNGFLFLPNSPTLMNAGRKGGQLSACYVLPIEDSISSIFSTLKLAALIQQSGGGTGFNFSKLRPADSVVSAGLGKATGPVGFIELYNAATESVKQAGKRRGANMGILNVNHPDITSFVSAKRSETALHNFNLSVGISDAFMEAVKENKVWTLSHDSGVKTTIRARRLWDLIINHAWQSGDPGIVFLDQMEKCNPTPSLGLLHTTNPCGEVPLLPYESCNLGSINLSIMVLDIGSRCTIDWEKLKTTVQFATRFLDNVIDSNHYVDDNMRKMAVGNRKIGLGVMGWADLLIRLEIPYESKEAVFLAERVMRFINFWSFRESQILASEKGNFPNWKKSVYYKQHPIRNATRTAIAPTGSISMIANASSSIEPLFALIYTRENERGERTQTNINRWFVRHLNKVGLLTQPLMDDVMATGHLPESPAIPRSVRNLFKTSLEISYTHHLLHQVAFQRHTDNAVSKTINMPEQTLPEEVGQAMWMAWQRGLKGVTVYRNGAKKSQVLNAGADAEYLRHLHDVNPCRVCLE
ncbi:MAG: adenosylcobalamin-dependent ribonucleoside-diphosphate reductase [Cyclobacteriaceae bacterium]